MTYTAHRDTQQTLAILDTLDMDKLSDEELARKFGWEEDYHKNRVTQWQRVKPKLWLLFDEPYSSFAAKVWFFLIDLGNGQSVLSFPESSLFLRIVEAPARGRGRVEKWENMKDEGVIAFSFFFIWMWPASFEKSKQEIERKQLFLPFFTFLAWIIRKGRNLVIQHLLSPFEDADVTSLLSEVSGLTLCYFCRTRYKCVSSVERYCFPETWSNDPVSDQRLHHKKSRGWENVVLKRRVKNN